MSEPTAAAAPPSEPDTGRLDGASRARIFSVIAVIVLFAEIAPLQYTMVGPAARVIQPSFPGVGSNIAWMTIIFGLVGGASTPIFGKLSDLYGKRNMLLAVGVAFVAGSLLDAITSNWTLFLVGRGLQAVAVAAATIAYGLIRDLIPRRFVPLAIGLVSTGLGISAVAGPLLGGYLTDHFSYKSLFWFLAIFTAVMMPALSAVCPETKLRVNQRLDLAGALLLALGVGSTLVYLSNGATWGWTVFSAYGYLLLGIVLLVLFVVVEKRATQPIIDLKLLFSPNVSNVLFIAFFASIVVGVQGYGIAYMVLTPTRAGLIRQIQQGAYEQRFKGLVDDPSKIPVQIIGNVDYGLGYTLLGYAVHVAIFTAIAAMVFGALSGELSGRRGARLPLLGAMIIFAATSAVYAIAHHGWVTLAILGLIFGIGFGGYYATVPNLLVEASPPQQQGITAGMSGVANSIGTAIGTGLAAAFQNANPLKYSLGGQVGIVGTPDNHGKIVANAFTDTAFTEGFIACAVAGLIAAVAVWYMKAGRTPATGGLAYKAPEIAQPVAAAAAE